MNHGRSVLQISSIAILACACACNNGNEGKPAPAASASVAPAASAPAPSASVAVKPHNERGPGHGGVDAVLFGAARDLQISDAQKAKLAALQDDMHDRDTDPRDAMKAFAGDLAAQVRAGKIDASQFKPDEAAFDTAMKTMLDKQATALAGLHDTLDAGQRKALADAVHAKADARDAEAKAHEGDAGAGAWIARRLDRMTNDLGLDAGQQKQLGAVLAKQPPPTAMRDDMKKQVDAVLTAFQADSFDATKVLQATTKTPREAMDRQISFTKQVLSILQPDQREKLAVTMVKPSGRGGPGGPPSDDDNDHVRPSGGGGGGN